MEFDFTASLNETRDIDLYGFSKKVDKNFDYINDIQIDIKWRAVMYMKDYGITDNWPIIDKISLDMDYQLLEEKKYELVLDNTKAVDDFLIEPLGASEKRERTKLKSEDKKWVVESSYSMRDESDTTLFITSIDIDFETKHIIVEF